MFGFENFEKFVIVSGTTPMFGNFEKFGKFAKFEKTFAKFEKFLGGLLLRFEVSCRRLEVS